MRPKIEISCHLILSRRIETYPRPTEKSNEPECPLSTIEHAKTGNWVHGDFTRGLKRDNLVLDITREIFDFLCDGHVVDVVELVVDGF